MIIPNISIQISANTVAWYGAIVATGSLLASVYNSWKDRARIKIKYQKGMRIIGSPAYSDKKTYFVITIINLGRRPIAIGNVGIRLFKGGSLISADSLNNSNQILTEEKPETQIMIDQSEIDFSNVHFIDVYDRAGREYKKYFYNFPTFKKLIYKLNHKKNK